MSNYRKGANAEREVVHMLEAQGYYWMRSAGSKGLFDIYVSMPTHARLIQVKSDVSLTPVEKEAIELFVPPPHTTKEVWTRSGGHPFEDRWKVEIFK